MQDHRKRAYRRGSLAAEAQRSNGPRRGRAGAALLMGCLVSLAVGCGAGMEGKGAQDPGAPPRTVADATAQFDQAERELRDSLLIAGTDRYDGTPPEPGLQPAQPGHGQPPPPAPGVGGARETTGGRPPCTVACRALASMERSAERLCSLTGEDDSRCTSVRHRVRAARRLVRQGCPSCQA